MKNLLIKFAYGNPGTYTESEDRDNLMPTVKNIINGIIAVLGIVCVVVIIYGGVNYMVSFGDAQKVKKAKDTILYGIIGILVCVLSFALVNFVIFNIIGQ